jgi:hypothetical protein
MSVISTSAMGGTNFSLPYAPPATSTASTTQLASGATVTTVRGSGGAVLSVTTASAGLQNIVSPTGGAQPDTSTVYVTA